MKEPKYAAEFRLIALCNLFYKPVSKAIVMCLNDFFHDIVRKNQSAFVLGRLITYNVFITMEMFHSMNTQTQS